MSLGPYGHTLLILDCRHRCACNDARNLLGLRRLECACDICSFSKLGANTYVGARDLFFVFLHVEEGVLIRQPIFYDFAYHGICLLCFQVAMYWVLLVASQGSLIVTSYSFDTLALGEVEASLLLLELPKEPYVLALQGSGARGPGLAKGLLL